MYKIFTTFFLLLFYSTSFGFYINKPINLTDEEIKWLEKHKNIILSVPKNFPPFLIETSSGYNGIAIDYIELLNEKINTNIKIIVTDNLKDSRNLFKQSKIDGFLFSDSSRGFSESLLETDVILSSYFSLYSRKNSNIDPDQKFLNMKFGFDPSMEGAAFLKSLDGSIIKVKYDNYEEMSQSLLNQEIDYVFDLFAYEYWINSTFQSYIHKSVILKDHKIDLSSYIRSDWPEFVSILNKFIEHVRHTELTDIGNKWLYYNKNTTTSNLNLSAEEIKFLLENPVINYTHDKNWFPVEFIDKNGKHVGISSDFLDEISKILNIQFNAIPLNSLKEAQEKVRLKEVDLFPLISKDIAGNNFLLTTPYVSLKSAVFSSEEHLRISGIQSLKDKKIAVIKGFAIHNWVLKHHPDLNLVLADDIEHAFKLLKDKEAYAFLENLMIGSAYISNNKLYDVRVIGDIPFEFELSMAVRKDLPLLHSAMQKALDAIPENKNNEIFNKWMTIKYEHLFDISLIKYFVSFFILLFTSIVFFIFSNKRLKSEISARKITEEELIESKNKYKDLLHHAAEGIIITDGVGKITSVNRMSEVIFGYDESDLFNKSINILIPKKFQKSHHNWLSNYEKYTNKSIFNSGRDVLGSHKDGHTIDLQISISINDFDGTKHFLVLVQDITQRKEAERKIKESNESLELLSNTSFEAIIIHKLGVLLHANDQAFDLLGYHFDELINKNFLPIVMTNESALKAKNHFENQLTSLLELDLVHKNGSIINTESRATQLYFKNELVRAISIKDITQHKQQQLLLENARIAAENTSKAKSKFISSMSHELRTPLNAVIGFSQLLQLDCISQKDVKENASEIFKAGNHLLELINEILDLSAIESDNISFNYQQVDVYDILKSIHGLMSCLAKKHSITISVQDIFEDEFLIYVDPVKFKQIIINIISNALKYNQENGFVKIEAKINHANFFEIKIIDSGIGMTDEEIQLIFEPFNRLNQENTTIQGTGIGLTITKELIDAMGGKISVLSEKHVGTTFCVQFPMSDH